MSDEQKGANGFLAGISITLLSALVACLLFAGTFIMANRKGLEYTPFHAQVFQMVAMFVAIAMTQFLSRQIQGNKLSFMQAFLGGWMTNLILAIFIFTFYRIYFTVTKQEGIPEGQFGAMLFLYSGLGLMLSAILAIFFKKS